MGKRDEFWGTVPCDSDGQLVWPEAASARTRLVREVFGAKVIGALEAVLDECMDVASGNKPAPGSHEYMREAARRKVFAGMCDVERTEVQRLLKRASFGTLYWILVKLEHFPYGDVDFKVLPFTKDGHEYEVVGIEETELHHLYLTWLRRYSDLGDE